MRTSVRLLIGGVLAAPLVLVLALPVGAATTTVNAGPSTPAATKAKVTHITSLNHFKPTVLNTVVRGKVCKASTENWKVTNSSTVPEQLTSGGNDFFGPIAPGVTEGYCTSVGTLNLSLASNPKAHLTVNIS